jgi:hypothetical protein
MYQARGGRAGEMSDRRPRTATAFAFAVAGLKRDDIEITTQPNLLVVSGRKQEEEGRTYLHCGIAPRAFERQFHLADYVVVQGASFGGMLEIDLRQELPEAVKPRRIEIGNAAKGPSVSTSPTRKKLPDQNWRRGFGRWRMAGAPSGRPSLRHLSVRNLRNESGVFRKTRMEHINGVPN